MKTLVQPFLTAQRTPFESPSRKQPTPLQIFEFQKGSVYNVCALERCITQRQKLTYIQCSPLYSDSVNSEKHVIMVPAEPIVFTLS